MWNRVIFRMVLMGLLVASQALLMSCAMAEITADAYYPSTTDPFMGNWKGRWCDKEEVNPDVAAQVFPLGGDVYEIRLVSKLFMRCPPLTIAEAKRTGDTLAFEKDGYKGEIKGDTFTGGHTTGNLTFEMKRDHHESPTLGEAPPAGAVVLFDGKGFDAWETPEGWQLLDGGVMMVTPKGKDIVSKQRFKDVKLHVEFRLPLMPKMRSQQRGNSGVFLQGTYEVQVLDSYGLEGYYDECGALYKVSAPRVNACLPPLEWQVYDITFRAARFDANGQVTEYPRITVIQNGVSIQDDIELRSITAWKEKARLAPPPADPGPIMLQAHNNFVQYRNVWAVDLDAAK